MKIPQIQTVSKELTWRVYINVWWKCGGSSFTKCYTMDCSWACIKINDQRLSPVYFYINKLLQWKVEAWSTCLLIQLCKPIIVGTILMLLEVFECTYPPDFLLQKGNGLLCLADIPTYIELKKIKVDLGIANGSD